MSATRSLSTPHRARIATLALFVTLLAGGSNTFAQSIDKEGLHAEMASLEQQITVLKPQAANNAEAAAALAQAITRCDQISAQLGGDRPVPQGPGRASGANPDGTVPTVPPNCVPTTITATQSTPVPIVDFALSTSTLVVSGAGASLWDLNLTTSITHTFAGDLDITLTSPAGTVVTLTTDNGGGNDNVFNGTVWDDDANPGGAVPYTANDGLVTDSTYTNLVTETPLVPEEAMGAFVGENPNGTWTLSVSDDAAADIGSINSWSLEVTTFPAAPTTATTTATQSTPVAIVDLATATSTLAVAGAGTSLCDLNLTTNITHTFAGDLDFTLTSPTGTVVTLSTDNGGGNDNVFNGTVWDDDANPGGAVPYTANDGLVTDSTYVNLVTETPLVAEEAMAARFGENPNGTWTLSVSDDAGGDTGSIDSWSLNITTCGCVAPDADLSVGVTATNATPPLTIGDTIPFDVTATNNGPRT
jgi:subtilisin-like proprotein convertase family protein